MSQAQTDPILEARKELVRQRDEQYAEMTAAIEALDAVIARRTSAPMLPLGFKPAERVLIYQRMSAADAAAKYLKSVGIAKGTREIADELKAGGLPTKAKNFYSNLYSTLRRDAERFEMDEETKKWRLKGG